MSEQMAIATLREGATQKNTRIKDLEREVARLHCDLDEYARRMRLLDGVFRGNGGKLTGKVSRVAGRINEQFGFDQ